MPSLTRESAPVYPSITVRMGTACQMWNQANDDCSRASDSPCRAMTAMMATPLTASAWWTLDVAGGADSGTHAPW